MSTATAEAPKKKKKVATKVPEYLIYEVVKGKPIYYKGYKDVLNGSKTFEEITMESILQSWLKAQITIFIGSLLKMTNYHLTVGEMGINLSRQDKRGADISIFRKENFKLIDKFSDLPPEIIIEIDVRAEVEDRHEMDYVAEKTDDYHKFGVKRIIWIFTKAKKVITANAGQPWLMQDWSVDIEIMEGIKFNVADMVKNF
ncbi:MAG: Uma2 family endonuclease [Saprospiraceae bacterium]|nr:Uma2 family endonuclease [Saprospiraceae bacterium]MCF8250149.1 Uma2 family endonuclease [Saprospiraceae bacterium]MCF8279412.1 Uma2 family endonuclease [Bacteroidales bacterium]MCF8311203.1 Uma2 family endonuclease [Saprospiraceae bacterium]MCF8440417.1 Uma2 family endonuclease [Saprospiraceae bacterium]